MNYWGQEDKYILIECEKCGKVLKFDNKYFTVDSKYVKPNLLIQCTCGNSTLSTIYSKEKETNVLHCPKCKSSNIQIVPRKWSILSGFLTNKIDRVCVNCKHKF